MVALRAPLDAAGNLDAPVGAPGLDPVPLVVDLDGTLLRTNLIHEGILALLRSDALAIVRLLGWLLAGRAALRRRVVAHPALDLATVPVDEDLLADLAARKASGRMIVLATALDPAVARRAAQRFPMVDGVIAAGDASGPAAAARATRLAELFPQGFDYAGSAGADMPVWAAARRALVTGGRPAIVEAVRALGRPVDEIGASARPSRLRALFKGLRLHQWAKNALVFVPLVLGGRVGEPAAWLAALGAFLALGLIASATYLVNDLWDLPHDRAHWTKRDRPLASGRLPLALAVPAIAAGLALGLGLATWVGSAVLAGVLAYLALTLAYSLSLKRVPMLDALMLGSLFTMRLVIGVAAVAVAWSPWLLTFSMFLFTSLSFAKRHTELRGAVKRMRSGKLSGRGYHTADEPVVLAFGIAAGLASIVIFILYLANEAFRHAVLAAPFLLWSFPPILALFMSRVWLLAGRDELNDDPVAFAIRDRASLGLAGAAGLAFALAAFGIPGIAG
ncbi:UbiA family prenyltransferase [Methylobacterium radiodurans]|uniref:UbiA family prenyltransferase n=1 Tax=Methylobacterium radiodurans TaxID=2202828 RepID=A0A2U8VQ93_9HYPH|nr:UbiA family prenyltransferase [Methylobacterium radiodurans]AWN35834.1 UbiA family prenyltransferase [Methylobacterium radiodurans]